jgi:NADH-quinone oxidoreductase subunit J
MSDLSLTPTLLYLAGAAGAAGLYLMLRPGPRGARVAGILLGLAGLAWLLVNVLKHAPSLNAADGGGPPVFALLFSIMAVLAAVRMVTHPKPVYAAVYFILVVIASAGLFLLLLAEFMAFALLIVYAGAILIVYMFVLMLAQQSPSDGDVEASTAYDRVPREPFAAVVVGFMLFASVGECFFVASPVLRQPADPAAVAAADLDAWNDLDTMPKLVDKIAREREPATVAVVPFPDGRLVMPGTDGGASVKVTAKTDAGVEETRTVALTPDDLPGNTQRLGLALVLGFPGGLELAGIILLMAMYGAVVLARKQIELGEDDRRELAGLPRLGLEESEPPTRTGGRA